MESANSPTSTINNSLKLIKQIQTFYGKEFTTYFLKRIAMKTALVPY